MRQRVLQFRTHLTPLLRFTELTIVLIVASLAPIFIPAASQAQDDPCHTQIIFDRKMQASGDKSALACSQLGPCDNTANRDASVPAVDDPITYIRLYFHVFREDDGSNPAATESDIAAQVAATNASYLPLRIQFVYDYRFIDLSLFRLLDDDAEFDAMKSAFALDPSEQVNVYVASVNVDGSVFSYGTFPWDSDALGTFGGVVMNRTQFFPFKTSTLTHELGHCFGLWHTHHGVSEVSQCGACWESPGALDRDQTGDLCSDTDPTPTNYNCSPPGGTDPCSTNPWGTTSLNNFMSYSSCRTEFTTQQTGRVQCWLYDILESWTIPVFVEAAPTFGPAPLEVTFDASSPKAVTSWDWDFGDGESSAEQNPVHDYDQPGFHTVEVTINTLDGPYTETMEGLVSAYADTITLSETQVVSDIGKVDIQLHNYVPVTKVTVPFEYLGVLNMRFDSATVDDTRADGFNMIVLNNFSGGKKAAVEVSTSGTEGIAPGNGPVASLWFTDLNGTTVGENPVAIVSYAAYSPGLSSFENDYPPGTIDGSMFVSCCFGQVGDANGAGGDEPTVADVGAIVDFLFISGASLPCLAEADANQSGGSEPIEDDISVADIGRIIDHLFITGDPLPLCP